MSRHRRKAPSRRAPLYEHLFVASLFIAPLAIGSVHSEVIIAVCVVLVGATVLSVFTTEGRRKALAPSFLGLIALAGVTAIQLVPLPPSLHRFVAEHSQAVWSGALELAGNPGGWAPLSLAPSFTVIKLLELLALALAFLLAKTMIRSNGRRPLLVALALVGLACAVVAIVHRLLGMPEVYGLYTPQETAGAWHSAPLLNTNHLAGLMALCAPIAVGLGLDTDDRSRRGLWLVAAAVMGMVAVLTLSRGGVAALVLALGLLAILVARATREGLDRGRRRLWLGVGVVAALGGGLYVGVEAIIAEFLTGDNTSKAEIWLATLPMVVAFLPFGVGRGAFRDTFTAYDDGLASSATFTHPENFIVQWSADWGVIGFVAAAALIVLLARALWRVTRRASTAGAMAGATALLAQNLVDFSLELLGVALIFVAALAVVLHSHSHRWSRFTIRLDPRIVAASLVIATLATGGVAMAANVDLFGDDEETLRERATAERPDFDAGLAGTSVLRAPASYMVPYLAGVWEQRSGEGSGLSWLNRALQRNPDFGNTHLWIARSLTSSGRAQQALLEYRLAARLNPRLNSAVAREVASRWPNVADLGPLLREDPPNVELLDRVSLELRRAGEAEAALELDEALLERAPEHAPVVERVARERLREGRLDEATTLAEGLPETENARPLLLADLDVARGDRDAAIRRIERALEREPTDQRLLRALAGHRERADDAEGARQTYAQWERAVPRASLPSVLLARAAFEERQRHDMVALGYYERAATLGAGRPALLGVARVAERRGELTRALNALQRLRRSSAELTESDSERIDALGRRLDRARLEKAIAIEN